MTEEIPLVDLVPQHREIAAEIEMGFERVVERTAFVGGEEVARFEEEFAAYSRVRHCVGVANGTDALELVLRASDVGLGDEVALPANTFVATASAVLRAGAMPVLVDSDPVFGLLDPGDLAGRLTPRTKAVIPVHLTGQMAPVEQVAATSAGRVVVEDAAQSQGATRNGHAAGSIGLAAGVSFYPGKNLGAYGDAGAVLTNDAGLATAVRALGNYGSIRKYEHPVVGFNSRLDGLQAVVLRAKLGRLDAWNEARIAAAGRYGALLAGVHGVRVPQVMPGNVSVWHLYMVRLADGNRDRVAQRLRERGIGVGVHYPLPLHMLPALAFLGHGPGEFPNAERWSAEILTLPLYPHITAQQQERVVEELAKAVTA